MSSENSPLNSPAEIIAVLHDDEEPRPLRRSTTSSSLFSAYSSCSRLSLDLPQKTDPSVYLTLRSGTNSAVGAFSPTPAAHDALQLFLTPQRKRRRRPATASPVTPLPERALTIPSISRAPPPISDRAPPSPSSAPLLDFHPLAPTPPQTTLASVERRSRLTFQIKCATCRAPGTNFPACPRCGVAWCSRQCRIAGKQHACRAELLGNERRQCRTGTGISQPPIVLPSPR
ncbi:hypothetical protein R3P38DRAFT_2868754 [Favolaschia claudopus]|uniref:HIT-type domain-containing protein n=1 Tax=Favolaschia claudopus TaxID=2862362 RepID=A0AAW0DBA3_9AGAR